MPLASDAGATGIPTGTAVTVDPDELAGTGSALRSLADSLRHAAAPGLDTGEPYLSAAVADVEADWSQARDTLTSWFEATGAALQNAAAAYRDADSAVARAAAGSGPPVRAR